MIIRCGAKSLRQAGRVRMVKICKQVQMDAVLGVRVRVGKVKRWQPKLIMGDRTVYGFCEATPVPPGIIPAHKMKEQIEKDIQKHFASFQTIKNSLIHHITHHYNHSNQDDLLEVLSLLAFYPAFPLDTPTMLALYKLTCHNLHLKSVVSMNHLLTFVLVADPQASQSPIFHEFLRSYLQLPLQELKFKYQLDFASMSFTQAIRQFFGKLLHRGFLPRSPPYHRNLNVLDARRVLLLLRRNVSVAATLMVKKLNYTIFLEVKEFYEDQMSENLYHPRKVDLLGIFTDGFLQVLGEEIEMTHHEALHLRELYMKLYLTLPDQDGPHELEVFKYRGVIYLYRLAVKHIESLDHLKLEQINEKIDVVIEFVQSVDQNLQRLLDFTQDQLLAFQLDFEELLLVVLWAKKVGVPTSRCTEVFELIKKSVNCYTLWHYFQPLSEVLQFLQPALSIQPIVDNPENYSLLTLSQLTTLTEIFQQKDSPQCISAVRNVLRKVLSTDFQLIGGQEVILFLRISRVSLLTASQNSQETEALRVFVMRYVSDHHKQFAISEFEQIIILLLSLPQQACMQFDDRHGNYPLSVLKEISSYVSKVSLLFSPEVRERIAADIRLATD